MRFPFTMFLGILLILGNILNLSLGSRNFGTFFWLGWGVFMVVFDHYYYKWRERKYAGEA